MPNAISGLRTAVGGASTAVCFGMHSVVLNFFDNCLVGGFLC